jgi:hypothetical protein
MKAKPCKHTRRAVVEFHAVKLKLDADGNVIAWGNTPEMDRWGVVEHRRCAKCGEVGMFWARKGFGETTERKALARYGVKPAALPAPPNHKPKSYPIPPQEGLWPFPCAERPLQPINTRTNT